MFFIFLYDECRTYSIISLELNSLNYCVATHAVVMGDCVIYHPAYSLLVYNIVYKMENGRGCYSKKKPKFWHTYRTSMVNQERIFS